MPEQDDKLYLLIFHTNEPKQEHLGIANALNSVGHEVLQFFTGDYGGKKFGACFLFKSTMKPKEISLQLNTLLYGHDKFALCRLYGAGIIRGEKNAVKWIQGNSDILA